MAGPTYNILAALTGRPVVEGEVVTVDVSRVMAHDGSGPVVAQALNRHGITELAAADRTVFVFDHHYPPITEREADLQAQARRFAESNGIPVYAGAGIAHQLLPELGLIAPGTVMVGGDSHTCTGGAFGALAIGFGATDVAAVLATGRLWLEVPGVLRVGLTGSLGNGTTAQDLALAITTEVGMGGAIGMVVEFVGPAIAELSVADRMKLSNHAVEMGAVTGVFPVDATVLAWLAERGADLTHADRAVDGDDPWDLTVDLGDVVPTLARPSRPDRTVAASDLEPIEVNQVFIGSCAGGRLEDLHEAVQVLGGQKVHPDVRLLVGPASAEVYQRAVEDGSIARLTAAGATVLPPGCGACLGRLGTLAAGEVAVSTQNRNFVGRCGSAESEVYLGSPTTAANAALSGRVGSAIDASSR
ncbi:aconitase/3-isopropylmalate dehydratase large subunit family protein [Nocardia sp. NPDC005366]|uniref:3-isopropylmalate dehydratase large subunit n=1 Tax=Nocardia sp. NPDC005366 TaxID=3156878 RepID=UPI0033B05FCA